MLIYLPPGKQGDTMMWPRNNAVMVLALVLGTTVDADTLQQPIQVADYSPSATQQNAEQPSSPLEQVQHLDDLTARQWQQLSAAQRQTIARQYALSSEQYHRYLQIRATTAIGQYYADKHLNPNYMLASYALSQGDRSQADQYIANYARNEYAEVSRQLYIQRKFQQAVQSQHPDETPIRLHGPIPQGYTTYGVQKQSATDSAAARLFTRNTPTPQSKYVAIASIEDANPNLARLAARLQAVADTRLDIYFPGKVADAAILAYVRKNGLARYVAAGQVTVNHAGKFVPRLAQRLQKQLPPGTLLKEDNGGYYPVSWSDLDV